MNWTRGIDYPEWMNDEGLRTLQSGYLQEGETPKDMYNRVCNAFSEALYRKWCKTKGGNYEEEKIFSAKLFDLKRRVLGYLWNNWLCLATPVASNLGTKRGLPISCYVTHINDTTYDIYDGVTEMAMLTKGGGGVGTQWNDVRPRGTEISTGGYTEGIIPFLKVYDSAIIATSQGSTRRGAASVNLSINHGDWHEFIKMRRPEGDVQRQCLNLHHCTDIPNQFMERLSDGIGQDKWLELLKTRMETGESYISFSGNIGRVKPDWYKNYWFKGTNICCVTGDTKILTDEGYQPIINTIDNSVNIWDGLEFVKVLPQFTGIKNCYKVTLSNGVELKVSDNHKFPVLKDKYNDNRKGKYTLKEIKDIPVGTALAKFNLPIIKFDKENDPDVGAYQQGFYSGDGNTGLKYSWVYAPKYVCMDRLGNVEDEEKQNCRKLWRHGQMLAKNYVPIGCSIDYKINWLAGILDSDGTTASNTLQIASIDKEFLMNIRLMLTELGIDSRLNHAKKAGNYMMPDGRGGLKEYACQQAYRLLVNSKQVKLLISLGLRCERIALDDFTETNRDCTSFITIKAIEHIGEHKTYCFNNPKTNLGCFEGVITGQSEVIPFLHDTESFVCCLSSANIAKFDEWKDDELFISDCIWFLNGTLDDFIEKSENKKGFEKARNFAIRHRSIGLGWIGLHTYLQEHSIPFVSLQHRSLTNIIGKKIWDEGWKASKEMCEYYEQPDVMKGYDYYNGQLFALAPTTSNAIISGGISQEAEPIISNYYNQKSAKGTFIRKNPTLVKVLETYGKNTDEIWDSILVNNGSVQHFDWMNNHDKEVFLTFVEINQLELVKLAAIRQKYVDQAQSLNLCFPSNVDIKWLHQVHYTAWQEGIKTLYYLRTTSPLRGDLSLNTFNECVYCES